MRHRVPANPLNTSILVGGIILSLATGCSPAGAETPKPIAADNSRLVANLHVPEGDGPFPGVLLVGGSGGGIEWQDQIGALLASKGFAALALAYFDMTGLPNELERIPLEYLDEALDYLAAQEAVDPDRLGVVGVSKGGELALLLASRDPRLIAVVAFVPSSVVFQSIAEG